MGIDDKEYFINDLISNMPGFCEFMESHSNLSMQEIINQFKNKLECEGNLSEEVSLTLSIILEQAYSLNNSKDSISTINSSLSIDDSDLLTEFLRETKPSKNEWHFKRAEKQHYKTITEKIAYKEYDYSVAIEKYSECYHPYIYSKMALAFLNSKIYDIGLGLLQKALAYVFSFPNVFWHNHLAVYGCVDALYELQHQLGHAAMFDVSSHLFKDPYAILRCLYLYLSRAIYMSSCHKKESDDYVSIETINRINYLSSRADLLYDYRLEFANAFPLGINPEIQFISDKYLASYEADAAGIGIVGIDAFSDSMKMYRHGSFIPNDTGGYCEIEDATYFELVERGKIRSYMYANDLYEQYKKGAFALSKSDLADCIGYVMHLRKRTSR